MLPQERADRRRTDPDAELAQLALDPHAAPARVLARQPQDQLPPLGIERRPARRSAPIRPLPPHKFPLPTQKRLRRHHEHRPPLPRQQAAHSREHNTIPPSQLRPLRRPPQANLLFALVSRRYERGSIIVTSNRGFEQWGEIL
jgi:hypothetical protein